MTCPIAQRPKPSPTASVTKPAAQPVSLARPKAVSYTHLDVYKRQQLPQLELFAEELRLAQIALGSITGKFSADDLLGEIFGRFCIGK